MNLPTQNLQVAALQTTLHWEDPTANVQSISQQIKSLDGHTDLIVLPEMWATGFTMQPKRIALDWDDCWKDNPKKWPAPMQAMLRWSQEKDAAVVGSLSCKIMADARFVNRCFFISPSNQIEWYDKRHLFGFAGEDQVYSQGDQSKTIHWRGWRLNLQICYDLRFPVFSRNKASDPYDVIVYVANWPEVRISAWQVLLQARSIENQCYTIGVNRIGTDGNRVKYNGQSAVLHPKGQAIASSVENETAWIQATLSADELTIFRSKFPVLQDADAFELKQTRSNP